MAEHHPVSAAPEGGSQRTADPLSQNLPTIALREKLSYGCGDLSSNLMWGVTASFILYYYTDVYQIAVERVALMLLVVRVIDACFDPLVGWLIDCSRDADMVRRLIAWLAVPFGLIALLAFLPLPLSDNGKLAWTTLTYTLLGAIYAGINTPYGILSSLMTPHPQQRVVLNAFRAMGSQSGMLLIALLTLPAVHWLGGGSSQQNELKGFPLYMAGVGALGCGLWFVTLKGCVIRYRPDPHRFPLKILLGALLKNRDWLLCTLAFGLYYIILSAFYSFALYFARGVLMQSTAFGGYILTLITFFSVTGSACVPLLIRYVSRRTLLLAGYVCQAALLILIGLIPLTPLLFMLLFPLVALQLGVNSPIYYSIIADSIDAGMAKTGVRTAGLAWSLNTLMTKVAYAVGGSLLAMMLSLGHYDPQALIQSELTARYVKIGFIWMPLMVYLISLPVIWRLPRDRQTASNK